MRRRRNHRSSIGIALACVTAAAVARPARADKIDLMAGFYDLNAVEGTKSSTVSGFGAYQIEYRHPIFRQFEVGIGYSLLVAGGLSSSTGYGIDFGMNYYPFSQVEPEVLRESQSQVTISDLWRPYIGPSIDQRQFSGTGFTGVGANAGVERTYSGDFSIKGEARYLWLNTGSQLALHDLDILVGITFHFALIP